MEIGRGAEAVVEVHDGVVVKNRVKKGYRDNHLDESIRKERTRREARMMKKAGQFIRVPKIIEEEKFTLRMELVDGIKIRDMRSELKDVAELIGETVGRLHGAGIVHQDLTTSNMILKDGEIYLIDFGLADYGKVESFAVDLKVLRDALGATHGETTWELVVKGYLEGNPKGKAVLDRLKAVDKRGRYKIRQSQAHACKP